MITIPIKIKREDKVIMVKALECLKTYPLDISDLNRVIVYEIYIEILSKLRASQHNDKSIRLNLTQAQGFMSYLGAVYATIGDYELANAHILTEDIKQKIYKKAITLKG